MRLTARRARPLTLYVHHHVEGWGPVFSLGTWPGGRHQIVATVTGVDSWDHETRMRHISVLEDLGVLG